MESQKREKKYKEKRRSNEKRKERSRDAARCRRSKETDIFTELAAALPVPPEQAAHLDKASVMRLAIAYLKVRAVVDSIPNPFAKSESPTEIDKLYPKALNGFMLVLSSDGNMVYLSENVSEYLGVSQMDMMGQSVYEYSHPCDHEELRECLSSKPLEINEKRACNFLLRLKCTLTNKGRKVNLKSASYKVIHCTGRLTNIRDSSLNSMEVDNEELEKKDENMECEMGASLVLVGCPIPHPSNIEIPLGRQTFLSKHSLSMKFTYADEKLAEYLGWNSDELMGQSVFEFYHALDNLALDKSFKSLFSKGQCETVAYRFLGKKGGYAWVVTQATLIHCSKQHKPLSVVCVNYILSGVEREDEVYSVRQLAARDTEKNTVKPEEVLEVPKVQLKVQINDDLEAETEFDQNTQEETAVTSAVLQPQQQQDQPQKEGGNRARPLTVTASIFRTADNNKKEVPRVQDGSRKDNTFPRPVPAAEKNLVGVEASLKESLAESLKENDEPARKRIDCKPSAERAPFIFQGKPAVEYDSDSSLRRDRPQAVTRHLFAPLAANQQQQQQQEQQISCRPPPQTATASIFAPRTEDMNKGFLTFSEDQPGLTMLKDEPEDLTHLAPTPGDVCVPLEDTPFLSDMLDEFILGNDNYCPLLSPSGVLASELRSADPLEIKDTDLADARNKGLTDPLADSDPFMYGDSPGSPCSIDSHNVSPPLKYRQSPEQSVDSLGSPTGGSGGDGLSEDEMLMLGINDSIGDDELALRAPYIPMSDQDEALELLISDDMVMWGPSQSEKASSKWLIDERDQRGSNSSLAQLLRTEQTATKRYNDHGGGLVNPAQVLGQIPRKNVTLDSRWTSKLDRTVDRPSKRIHTSTTDTGNENKRIKCDDPSERNLRLEDHVLLGKHPTLRKSSGIDGNQILRRLVSQQTVPRNSYSNQSPDNINNNRRNGECMPGLNDDNDLIEEKDGDGGGGGGGGGCERGCRDGLNSSCQNSQRDPPCNSVLMNLLVSGCDDTLMDSRNVPMCLIPKGLTSPLSVSLDNQLVPDCSDSDSSISLDHLNPDTKKQLGPLSDGGSAMTSPSSGIISFDQFDYDVGGGTTGLLQVGSDLLGPLLDRNLV